MRHLLSTRLSGHPASRGHVAPQSTAHLVASAARQPDGRQATAIRRVVIGTIVLVFALAVAPGVALASSLLSGYGAPGEGSEAIVGSALANGPSGGAGTGAPGRGSAGAAGADSSVLAGGEGSGRGSSAARRGGRTGLSSSGSNGAGAPGTPKGRPNGAAARRAGSPETVAAVQAADRGGVESEDLGMTTTDLICALLVLAALAAVWALTVRVARAGADGSFSGAKGTAPGTRLKP
jgi:hypothetical protein